MAQPTETISAQALQDAGIDAQSSAIYAEKFAAESLTIASIDMLDKESLISLGITKLGHQIAIFKLGQQTPTNQSQSNNAVSMKLPPAKAPLLMAEMTTQQFRKYRIDWEVFCDITGLPANKHHSQIYANAEEAVQTAIINTYPNFFDLASEELLDKIEQIVTHRSNPMVHRLNFSNLNQSSTESIQSFVVRLRSAAKDCNFSCPSCKSDISSSYIRDQFIIGLSNQNLQTDLLAKAEALKDVEQTVKHAEAFESALRDQSKIDKSEVAAARMSSYRNTRNPTQSQTYKGNNRKARQYQQKCSGCAGFHNPPFRREEVCPAWGKRCTQCHKMNHISRACKQYQPSINEVDSEDNNLNQDASMCGLIAHISFDRDGRLFDTFDQDIVELEAEVSPFSPIPETRSGVNIPKTYEITRLKVFPDSGASICLGGTKHLSLLGLMENNLVPCNKTVSAVGNHKMKCIGWLPVEFKVGGITTKQALYICRGIEKIYFSKKACIGVGLLPEHFPKQNNLAITAEVMHEPIEKKSSQKANVSLGLTAKTDPKLPNRPTKIPFHPTPENVPKLKNWLIDAFKDTAFSKAGKNGKFPHLSGPPAHVHLKSSSLPRARHCPIPVPFHLKKAVKAALDEDVLRGIITPVPLGTPTEWCSTMVVMSKKDGRPRRTVDYQYLNDQCLRETHHQESPFHLAMQVPAGAYKTVLDAVDGYHSVLLDEESQPLTTFITEWGRYMYTRMPQGFIAAGDAYTSRYDQIIAEVVRKVKIVDDVLLYDFDIEKAFFHVFDFLCLAHQNGVVLNIIKFQFCQMDVQFAGLTITSKGVVPSNSMLSAIADFPVPTNLTDARSWFGLVNQVAWAYSLGPIMQPFRDLIKSKSEFNWTASLQNAFEKSKNEIVQLVKEGVSTFDVKKTTCLAPDWSKQGMGFLLLQKYCLCPLTKAPVCCPEGWRLVFAGSRFCTEAESRYAPIEGEASAIAWSLNKCRMYVMGCPNLIVVTDHAPLLGIFSNRDLSKINNPRLLKLKEKTLFYRFSIQHCPGKWHRGSDAVSRNIGGFKGVLEISALTPTEDDDETSLDIDSCYKIASVEAVSGYTDELGVISPDDVRSIGRSDPAYSMLITQISKGFPTLRRLTDPLIRDFWEVRHRLSAEDGLVMVDKRIVIPSNLRVRILKCLHSAHQGIAGMKSRASDTVYWPGMDSCIRDHKDNCTTCTKISPTQSKEPIVLTKSPDWPFQKIAIDIFFVDHHAYLACADRFTGWLILYHLPQGGGTSTNLINICRGIFQTYGVPEELSRDGGPPMQSQKFLDFLKAWKVKDRVSSVAYPQSNGRAELAVKTAKRIVYDNISPNGSLDTDRAARAILQYRNTPIQGIGLSPAQLLLHRQLRDCIPSHPILYKPHKEWLIAGYEREKMLSERNAKLVLEYNKSAHHLPPLMVGDNVVIQNRKDNRWSRTGIIVEKLDHRQYWIRMNGSGRLSLQNRRFLKKVSTLPAPHIIPSPNLPPPEPNVPKPETPPTSPPLPTPTVKVPVPRAVTRLQTFYNNAMSNNITPGRVTRSRVGRGLGEPRGDVE